MTHLVVMFHIECNLSPLNFQRDYYVKTLLKITICKNYLRMENIPFNRRSVNSNKNLHFHVIYIYIYIYIKLEKY